jgi:hypothetical protein
MKRLLIFAQIVMGVLVLAPAAFGDIVDYMLNVNGTTYCPSYSGYSGTCSNYGGLAAAPVSTTLDLMFGGTGLGSVSLTYNPGSAGTFNVGLWLFEELVPAVGGDEYGATGGTPATGQTWQVDVPDYDYNSSDPNFGGLPAGAGTIVGNTAGSTLANFNYLTGNTSQFSFNCSGSTTCNDYTSMAMGFNFTLASGQEEVMNFNVSTTVPTSGFYLEQIAPVDAGNATEVDYYYTANASTQPIGGGGVPEPGTAVLLGSAMAGILGLAIWRRASV